VQPIFREAFAGATPDQIRIVDDAIGLAERASATGKTPAIDLGKTASGIDTITNEVMRVSLGGPIHHGQLSDGSYATVVLTLASSAVRLLENPPDLVHASIAVKLAQMASGYVTEAGDPLPESIGTLIHQDYEILIESARRLGWTDRTPVPPSVFGPLWPNGIPKGWPQARA